MSARAILLALAIAGAAPAAAQSIEDAAWLAGRWVGEGLGGSIEETWAPAAGGQMVGHFQLVRNGKPAFYEIMLLDRIADGLRLRVKHFNPDFTALEDKGVWHSFEPVGVTPDQLKFKGLALARDGDRLSITIRLRDAAGVSRDHLIRLRRAPL